MPWNGMGQGLVCAKHIGVSLWVAGQDLAARSTLLPIQGAKQEQPQAPGTSKPGVW